MKRFWIISLIVTFFILIILILFASYNIGGTKFNDFYINLISEIIGILIVVFLIERIISKFSENEKTRIIKIAISQLELPLRKHSSMFFEFFRASTLKKPKKEYKSFDELFNDDYYKTIKYLDFSFNAPIIYITNSKVNWYSYIGYEFNIFKDTLNKLLNKYASFFNSDKLMLIENIINSDFLRIIIQICEYSKHIKFAYDNMFGEEIAQEEMKKYLKSLSELINLYNETIKLQDKKIYIKEKYWQENEAPKFGSSRTVIEPKHKLTHLPINV